MATPRADTYSAVSGASIYAGMSAPAGVPAWLSAISTLNAWTEIPSAAGAGGASMIGTYSGCAWKESTREVIIALAGGHLDSADNRVVSCALSADAPTWASLKASDWNGSEQNVGYYASGSPTSRHTYWNTIYVPARDRVFTLGTQFAYGNAASTFAGVDGFNLNPAVRAWDAQGTYADINVGAFGQVFNPTTQDIWSIVATKVYRWSQSTATQALVNDYGGGSSSEMSRFGAWDTLRDQLVTIGFGDGFGGTNLAAWKIAADGMSRTSLTLTGTGLSQFTTAHAPYASIQYDPGNDRFLWLGSAGGAAPTLYAITPNSGASWDISVVPTTGATLGSCGNGSWPVGNFHYAAAYGGFFYLDPVTRKLYFLRTV